MDAGVVVDAALLFICASLAFARGLDTLDRNRLLVAEQQQRKLEERLVRGCMYDRRHKEPICSNQVVGSVTLFGF